MSRARFPAATRASQASERWTDSLRLRDGSTVSIKQKASVQTSALPAAVPGAVQ